MVMDLRIVSVLAVGPAGCATRLPGETVFLENASGERVQCGPYTVAAIDARQVVQAQQVQALQLGTALRTSSGPDTSGFKALNKPATV